MAMEVVPGVGAILRLQLRTDQYSQRMGTQRYTPHSVRIAIFTTTQDRDQTSARARMAELKIWESVTAEVAVRAPSLQYL